MTLDKSIILSKPQFLNCKMENYTSPDYLIGKLQNKAKNGKKL